MYPIVKLGMRHGDTVTVTDRNRKTRNAEETQVGFPFEGFAGRPARGGGGEKRTTQRRTELEQEQELPVAMLLKKSRRRKAQPTYPHNRYYTTYKK
jgi:hypothetical protein